MSGEPCHKCLVEVGWSKRAAPRCLRPATHIWKPVEGAEVPLCDVHAMRLSKLPSLADTIKPIQPPTP